MEKGYIQRENYIKTGKSIYKEKKRIIQNKKIVIN